MSADNLQTLKEYYRQFLLDNVIPFWLANGIDREYGGILTCLDRQGRVYNTDKSVWFQGRACWSFSRLYNTVDRRPEWLEAAKSAYQFLVNHCFDSDGRMFFTVTRDGRPLQKRRYYYSETFAIIGLAEYARASGDQHALEKARQVYEMVLDFYRNPWKLPAKINPATRVTKALAVPMILLATTQTLREHDPDPKYDTYAHEFATTILKDFFKPDEKALLENVGPHGERLDSPQGRCVNPGHSIETAWFLMHEGVHRHDDELIQKALMILEYSLELGWDETYGGLLYFVDIEGKPPEQLEWDMKLWWPHTEALYALLLAYHLTKDSRYLTWHEKVHDYSFSHFSDSEWGEWYGYLHRDGTVSNTLKGSIWKGPFHLPRALLFCWQLLEKMK